MNLDHPSIGWVTLHVPCDSENAQLLVQVDGQVCVSEMRGFHGTEENCSRAFILISNGVISISYGEG